LKNRISINEYLKSDKKQRVIYGIGILLWIALWFDSFRFINQSNIGIYSFQIIIPLLLLIGQLILNKKEIWILLISYLTLYTLWVLKNMLFDILMEYNRDYSPQPVWTYERIKESTIMILILFTVNWIIWKMKPQKTITIE
jgi:hypothetical protein